MSDISGLSDLAGFVSAVRDERTLFIAALLVLAFVLVAVFRGSQDEIKLTGFRWLLGFGFAILLIVGLSQWSTPTASPERKHNTPSNSPLETAGSQPPAFSSSVDPAIPKESDTISRPQINDWHNRWDWPEPDR
jgi:hypothetical protein